ncbi:hypothetical protein ACN081_01320 [Rothia sp. P13129]|uniref:hypothetical protein n=1 Tax=Rothia sp. P13129 TaxID=3402664 RepID=UPI003ACEAB5D
MEKQNPRYDIALLLTAIGILAHRVTSKTTKKLLNNQRDNDSKGAFHQKIDSLFGTILTRRCADLYAKTHPELQITVVDPNNDGWSEYQVPKEDEEGILHIFYTKNTNRGSQRKQELTFHNLIYGKEEYRQDQLPLFSKMQVLPSKEFNIDNKDIKHHGDKNTTFCQLFLHVGQNNHITGADFTAPLPTKGETLFSYSINIKEALAMADAMWEEGAEWLIPAIDLATTSLNIPKLEKASNEGKTPAAEPNAGREIDTSQEPMMAPVEDKSLTIKEGEERQTA